MMGIRSKMLRLTVVLALLATVALGSKVKHQTRVINGWTANDGYYKYFAFIYINQNPYCGGTIIKENLVLSAASTMFTVDPSTLRVYGGMTKLTDAQSINPIGVNKILVHPNFQSGKADYDAAIVFLKTSFTFNTRVGSIGLSQITYPINYVVTLMGFGLANCNQKQFDQASNAFKCTGGASEYLRVGYMNIKGYQGNTLVTNNTFNGVNPCYGDFGGPVVYDNVLVGVQSLIQNADCTGDSYHASVPRLYPWVTGYM